MESEATVYPSTDEAVVAPANAEVVETDAEKSSVKETLVEPKPAGEGTSSSVHEKYLEVRKRFFIMRGHGRTKEFSPSPEALLARRQAFSVMDADDYQAKYGRTWDKLFPERKGANRQNVPPRTGNMQNTQDGIWDNPTHAGTSQGIFSNGDIRTGGRGRGHHLPAGEALKATDLEAQAFAGEVGMHQPQYPARNRYQQQGEPQGAQLLNWLTGGTANPPQMAPHQMPDVNRVNRFQTEGRESIVNMQQKRPSDNVMNDEAMVLNAAANIPELRGHTLDDLMKMVTDNPELGEKLVNQINEISKNSQRYAQVSDARVRTHRVDKEEQSRLKEQYRMTISQMEGVLHQLDHSFHLQHSQLSRQMQQMCSGRTQEELQGLSQHIQSFQHQLNYLGLNYQGQRQLVELQVSIWRNISEQEELMPFEIARNTVAHQVQLHQQYMRQQQMQQQNALQQQGL